MSSTPSHSTDADSDASSPYSRENWWGEDLDAGDDAPTHGTDWTDAAIRDAKAAHATHLMLRGVAPKLCGVSVDDPAKTAVELTEPCVYPHGEGNREHLRRARVNERDGYITGGESTGVRLGDVSEETFFDVVELLLGYWKTCEYDVDAEQLMIDAKRMRSNPDVSDVEAIERLARDVLPHLERFD